MNYTEDVGYNFGKVDDLHVLDDAFRLQILKIEDKKKNLSRISNLYIGAVCTYLLIGYDASTLVGKVFIAVGFGISIVVPACYLATMLYKRSNETGD